jgi:hypothetical protein
MGAQINISRLSESLRQVAELAKKVAKNND